MKLLSVFLFCMGLTQASVIVADATNLVGSRVEKTCKAVEVSTKMCTKPVNFEPALNFTITLTDDAGTKKDFTLVASGGYDRNVCLYGRETCEEAAALLDNPRADALETAWKQLSFVRILSEVQSGELSFTVLKGIGKVACYRPVAKLVLRPSTDDQISSVIMDSVWAPCPQDWLVNSL